MPPPTPKENTTLEIGQLFGHSRQFKILKLLGRGGYGEVYLASEERANRHVAIKVLRPEHNKSEGMLRRFRGEYTLANLLGHPSLVQMIDLAQTSDGVHYIAMEYLDGVILSARMAEFEQKDGQLGLERTLNIGWQIASVLSQLHARNIIHRDLKPGNIMLVRDAELPGGERVKLLDFGIAKLTDMQRARELSVDFNTSTKDHLGTPAFMAPEIFKKGAKPGTESDVYSLGCILYRCLAGNYPFAGETDVQVILAHMTQQPIPIQDEDPSIPPDVAALIDGMLEKEPIARPSMATIASQLGRRLGVTTLAAGQVVIRSSTSEIQAIIADLSTGSPSITVDAQPPAVNAEQPVMQAGQQITTTQTRSSRQRYRLLLSVGGGIGLVAIGGAAGMLSLRHQNTVSVNQPSRPGATIEKPVTAPTVAPPMLSGGPPAFTLPSLPAKADGSPAAAPLESKAGRAKCEGVEPTAACIQGAVSDSDKTAFVRALSIAEVKLCPGDFLAVVGKPQMDVTKSKGVSRSKKEAFVFSLRGNPTKIAFSGEVMVRCGKGK